MDKKEKANLVGGLLGEHFGKIFRVKFKKKTGEIREMTARQGVKNGSTPLKGGEWANGMAGKATDHLLILCTDIDKEREGENSRRSFSLDSVIEISAGGQTLTFED